MQTAITTADTRSAAHRALSNVALVSQLELVYQIVKDYAHTKPDRALSAKEIQHYYNMHAGKFVEASSLSPRINSLVAAGRLHRLSSPRPCTITGRNVLPVRLSQTQKPMFEGKQ